ncbi:MAG: internalin, partial [Actinobacteria bacterium]|nr:internalin [Actinomycetota bacterium]
PAQVGDKNSVATLVSEVRTGPDFARGSLLIAKVEVNDLEQNEVVIVRMDVKIECDPRLKPTGDLQARFNDALLTFKNGTQQVLPAEDVGVGEKTVPLKKLVALAVPQLTLSKTVTTGTGTCPGVDSLTALSNELVKYCYAVINTDNGSNPPAPIYNLSVISDDSGIFPDFTVPITSGLSDQDGDGSADDLAAGATAYAEVTKSFEVNINTTVFNTATVFGYDSIINPLRLDATDSATLNVIAPALVPSISINKLTNGSAFQYLCYR